MSHKAKNTAIHSKKKQENDYFCNMMKNKVLTMCALLLSAMVGSAKVQLPQIFQSGMVLQRGMTMPVWGQADPSEAVTVKLNKKVCSTTADAKGYWRVDLPAMKAGGPYELTVNDQVLNDVWVGDVWLCSGQSNMETTVERVYPQYPDEIDAEANDRVRLFHVAYNANAHGEQADLKPAQEWQKLNKTNAWRFSAIGYFLGKHLQQEKGVAQGIIESAWGGTPIEAWIAPDTIARHYPVYHRQTLLYQNDDFLRAQQQANMLADRQWQQILAQSDPGCQKSDVKSGMLWTSPSYDDSNWAEVNQYALNAYPSPLAGRRQFIGTIWLRQHIHISKEHAGKKAQLLLGTLYDCDFTYINGQQVGNTGYQYPPRRYQVPEGLLREGDNVITVRFINKNGIPYFVQEKPYRLVFGKDDIQPLSEQWKLQTGAEMPRAEGAGVSIQNQPSVLYNGMIRPIAPFAVAGVLWYQGESNTGKAREYEPMLRLLMSNWREAFQRPDLPFVIIQLANYMAFSEKPQDTGWSQVREAQRTVATNDERAELALTIDLGETVDIHPLRKKEVALRVAQCLDKLVYGKKNTVLAPQVVNYEVKDGSIILTMDQPMQVADVKYFEVAGNDGRFTNTTAKAEGNRIVIASPLPQPTAIRYAWKDNPIGVNAYSQAGWPLSPFQLSVK